MDIGKRIIEIALENGATMAGIASKEDNKVPEEVFQLGKRLAEPVVQTQ